MNDSVICANGRSWAENENYYPFLIAKAIVQEGWDNENNNEPPGIGEAKRPYVWVRSMCAGAQRYATYWSGDIFSDCKSMEATIRTMQISGLAGFPYFNHDAGGFRRPGPDDNLFIQWEMGFGSFTPIWRPHGIGNNKRWPLDRSDACQDAAMKYGKKRYEMMPYIYTYAYNAYKTGMPMAKAMIIDYQQEENAWKYDLQYMWGNELLVAPKYTKNDTIMNIWLPQDHDWYKFWTDEIYHGNQILAYQTQRDEMPIFVKSGAIIPKYGYAQSTYLLNPKKQTGNIMHSTNPNILHLDVYIGDDGEFYLYEDDGITEKFQTKNELRITHISYHEASNTLIIHPAQGNYEGCLNTRVYQITFHGIKNFANITLNDKKIREQKTADHSHLKSAYYYQNKEENFIIYTPPFSTESTVKIEFNRIKRKQIK
jgi:alpha-D-xyloside xylohydrolase